MKKRFPGKRQQEKRKRAVKEIARLFRTEKSFLIIGHVRPDGDTVGSALAIGSWLGAEGRRVKVVNADNTPQYLMFLKGAKRIKRIHGFSELKNGYDVCIVLECPDVLRIGFPFEKERFKKTIIIDHHPYGKKGIKDGVEFIDPRASSCAELVWDIMEAAGHKVTRDEAVCLYTGILTDTGKFQYENTTGHTLHAAAAMVDRGVDPVTLYQKLYVNKTLSGLRLLGGTLSSLKVDGKVAYLSVTDAVLKKHNASDEDTEGIIHYAGLLKGIGLFVMFRELRNPRGTVKVSLRSYGKINANRLAGIFGGGGHIRASGFQIKGTVKRVIPKVLSVLKRYAV